MAFSPRLLIGATSSVVLGTGIAVAGAYGVDKYSETPPFSLNNERFDQTTFMGRYKKMLSNVDPSTLLKSDAEVLEAKRIMDLVKNMPLAAEVQAISKERLWELRKLKESAVHPDTGELVPRPFRMAGYVPFNGPICAAMMLSTSTPMLLFWNWVNQSQNALVNYFNRNASSEMSDQTLAISYAGAVTSALTVAFGLSQLIKRTASPQTATKLLKFVAFPSSMVASTSNCYIMRRPEIDTGIEIIDEKGHVLANGTKSIKAAEKAVYETVISRALLQVPVFFGPAVVMSLPPVVSLVTRMPAANVPIMTLATMVLFSYGLPATIAYFPQIGSIPKLNVEPELQKFVAGDIAYYNKGL